MMQEIIKSDIGVVRSENQDRAAVFNSDKQTFMILCDGMGGHEGGSYAATIAINTFEKSFKEYIPENKINAWFEKTINLSKKEMIKFAKERHELLDMGTTLTAALVSENKIHIFNIGDSRTYIYDGLLHQITKDHNVRNYYIDKYNYSSEEAAKKIGAAALTYSLGPDKRARVDSFVVPINKKIKFIVLTSDGIHDYILKPTFELILSSHKSLEKKANKLIKEAIKGKSSDNLTVAILEMEHENARNN